MEFIKDCRECIYSNDCPTCWHKNNAACLTIQKSKADMTGKALRYINNLLPSEERDVDCINDNGEYKSFEVIIRERM